MKSKPCFVIFMMSAIIFSVMSSTNAGKDDIELIETGEDQKLIKERQSLYYYFNGLFEMIDTMRGKNKPPSAILKNFQNQYKNKAIKFLDFKNEIDKVLEKFYKAHFKVPSHTEQAKPGDTDINEDGEDDYEESLLDEIASKILTIISQIKEDKSCSATIVTDKGPTQGLLVREPAENQFNKACQSKSTDSTPTDNPKEK